MDNGNTKLTWKIPSLKKVIADEAMSGRMLIISWSVS